MIQSIPKLVEQINPHKHSKRANAKQKAESVKNRTVWNVKDTKELLQK